MAYQGISTGTSANDGTGDSLATGAVKINSNFNEIYKTIGNGYNLSFPEKVKYVINEWDESKVTTNFTGNIVTVVTTYNSLPIRGYLYYPTNVGLDKKLDVIVLYHPTIEAAGVVPFLYDGDPATGTLTSSAKTFLDIVINPLQVNIRDKIIFSVAYPQDMIPVWDSVPSRPAVEFPGIDYSTFYFGDNLSYALAALNWVKTSLNSYMVSASIPKNVGRIFTFGHSQGASLVHKLNTIVPVDGVISNAPGPIDLLERCSGSANASNPTCNKIRTGIGSTLTAPNAYDSVSLKSYLSGTLSPTLFTQALDDAEYQVTKMKTVMEPGLGTCTTCNQSTFNYYTSGGHNAFALNPILQQDIRNFVDSGKHTYTLRNVGIGTTNPSQKLTVIGNVLVDGGITANSINVISSYNITTTGVSKTLSNLEYCTVTSGGCTLTLPASPSVGNKVVIGINGTFTDTLIARNGSNIMGLAENMTFDFPYSTIELIYINSTIGWRIS